MVPHLSRNSSGCWRSSGPQPYGGETLHWLRLFESHCAPPSPWSSRGSAKTRRFSAFNGGTKVATDQDELSGQRDSVGIRTRQRVQTLS